MEPMTPDLSALTEALRSAAPLLGAVLRGQLPAGKRPSEASIRSALRAAAPALSHVLLSALPQGLRPDADEAAAAEDEGGRAAASELAAALLQQDPLGTEAPWWVSEADGDLYATGHHGQSVHVGAMETPQHARLVCTLRNVAPQLLQLLLPGAVLGPSAAPAPRPALSFAQAQALAAQGSAQDVARRILDLWEQVCPGPAALIGEDGYYQIDVGGPRVIAEAEDRPHGRYLAAAYSGAPVLALALEAERRRLAAVLKPNVGRAEMDALGDDPYLWELGLLRQADEWLRLFDPLVFPALAAEAAQVPRWRGIYRAVMDFRLGTIPAGTTLREHIDAVVTADPGSIPPREAVGSRRVLGQRQVAHLGARMLRDLAGYLESMTGKVVVHDDVAGLIADARAIAGGLTNAAVAGLLAPKGPPPGGIDASLVAVAEALRRLQALAPGASQQSVISAARAAASRLRDTLVELGIATQRPSSQAVWRGPGRVNWLLRGTAEEVAGAVAQLDAAFEQAVATLTQQLGAGLTVGQAIFATLQGAGAAGLLMPEACEQVRVALRERADRTPEESAALREDRAAANLKDLEGLLLALELLVRTDSQQGELRAALEALQGLRHLGRPGKEA